MAQLIILNGPPGVGKSTVTARLRELLPGTVAISGDALRGFAPADVRVQLGGSATYRAAGALAATYLELGAARVIVDYVFLRAAHFRAFREAAPGAIGVQIYTLWAPLERVLERAAERPAPPRVGPGVADSYREMLQNSALMGELVDNSSQDPEVAAARIHELAQ